jgi:hypothetical protein
MQIDVLENASNNLRTFIHLFLGSRDGALLALAHTLNVRSVAKLEFSLTTCGGLLTCDDLKYRIGTRLLTRSK